MEQNNFYFILGSRGNGKTRAQCDALERAYEEMRKKKQAERDVIGKIINAYTDELIKLVKKVSKNMLYIKQCKPKTREECIMCNTKVDALRMFEIDLTTTQLSIDSKIKEIMQDYDKEN